MEQLSHCSFPIPSHVREIVETVNAQNRDSFWIFVFPDESDVSSMTAALECGISPTFSGRVSATFSASSSTAALPRITHAFANSLLLFALCLSDDCSEEHAESIRNLLLRIISFNAVAIHGRCHCSDCKYRWCGQLNCDFSTTARSSCSTTASASYTLFHLTANLRDVPLRVLKNDLTCFLRSNRHAEWVCVYDLLYPHTQQIDLQISYGDLKKVWSDRIPSSTKRRLLSSDALQDGFESFSYRHRSRYGVSSDVDVTDSRESYFRTNFFLVRNSDENHIPCESPTLLRFVYHQPSTFDVDGVRKILGELNSEQLAKLCTISGTGVVSINANRYELYLACGHVEGALTAPDNDNNSWSPQDVVAERALSNILVSSTERARRLLSWWWGVSSDQLEFGNYSIIISFEDVPAQILHIDLRKGYWQCAVALTDNFQSTDVYQGSTPTVLDTLNGTFSLETARRLLGYIELSEMLQNFSELLEPIDRLQQMTKSVSDNELLQRGTLSVVTGGVVHRGCSSRDERAVMFFTAWTKNLAPYDRDEQWSVVHIYLEILNAVQKRKSYREIDTRRVLESFGRTYCSPLCNFHTEFEQKKRNGSFVCSEQQWDFMTRCAHCFERDDEAHEPAVCVSQLARDITTHGHYGDSGNCILEAISSYTRYPK